MAWSGLSREASGGGSDGVERVQANKLPEKTRIPWLVSEVAGSQLDSLPSIATRTSRESLATPRLRRPPPTCLLLLLHPPVARKVLTASLDGDLHNARFSEKALLTAIDREAVYGFYDDPCSASSALMKKIRAVLVDNALANGEAEKDASASVFSKINRSEEALPRETEAARVAFEMGTAPIANRIKESRSYPLYLFIRQDLGAVYLNGDKLKSPGQECNKVFLALSEGKLIDPMLDCLKEWGGKPLPKCPSAKLQDATGAKR